MPETHTEPAVATSGRIESSQVPPAPGHVVALSDIMRTQRSSVPAVWLIRRRATPVATTVPFPGTVIDTPNPVVQVMPIVENGAPSPEAIRVPGPGGPCVPFVPFVPGGPCGPMG